MPAKIIVGLDFFTKFFKNRIDPSKEKEFNEFVKNTVKNSDCVYISELNDIITSSDFLKNN